MAVQGLPPRPNTRVFDLGNPIARISSNDTSPHTWPRLEIVEPAYTEEQVHEPASSIAIVGWENLKELHAQLAAYLSEARMNGWIE